VTDKIGRHVRQPGILSSRPAEFDCQVLPRDESYFAQPFVESRDEIDVRLGRTSVQKSDHWHFRLLRARRERPRRRAAEKFAPSHELPSNEAHNLAHYWA
jgi:hypothetical protein